DADELWTARQIQTARRMFLDHPEKSAAVYWCRFFVGPDRAISTRGIYGNHPNAEWLRTWRYRPRMYFAAHEPPLLHDKTADGTVRNVAAGNIFWHEETEHAGLVFDHFAYTTREQARFKE